MHFSNGLVMVILRITLNDCSPKREDKMVITRFLYIPVILLFLLISHSKCLPVDLDMQIVSGFNNYHKQDHWLPLRITGSGDEIDGYVSISIRDSVFGDQQIYSTPISIFNDDKKVKYLYLRPERLGQSFDVNLTDKDGKTLLEKEARFTVIPTESTFVVVIDQNEDGVKNLVVNNIDSSRKFYVANVSAEYLPDKWKGYDSVDAIILGNFSIDSLSNSQKNAIIDWVCSGGTLIASGGINAQNFVGTFIEQLLPVKIDGTKVMRSIPSLTQRFGHDFPNTPIVVASTKLSADSKAIINEDDGIPVIAEKRIGTGKSIFLCFDYADPVFKYWRGNHELWNTIIPEPQKQATIKYDNIFRLLSAHRQLSIPSYKIIGGFLLIYVLCLGIVSYILFERKKGLTWVIMVLIAIVFTLGAMGFSYATGGRLPFISDLSVIDVYQDTQRAKIGSYVSPFSSAKAELKLDFTKTDAVFIENPGVEGTETYWSNNFRLIQGDVPKIEIFGMKTLSSHLLYSESYTDFSENVSVSTHDENVRITSFIPFDLLDCYLFLNERYAKINTLRSGERTEIKLNQAFSGNVFDSYSVEDDEKSRFINAIKPIVTDSALIGWIDGSALKTLSGMNVEGGYKSLGMALIIIHLRGVLNE